MHLRSCDYLDGRNPLILIDLQLFDEFTHSEVPNLSKNKKVSGKNVELRNEYVTYINIAVMARTGKNLLIELVEGSDGVVVNVFEKEDWVRLLGIPDANAPVDAARYEQVLVVEGADVVDARLLEMVGGQRCRSRKVYGGVICRGATHLCQRVKSDVLIRLPHQQLVPVYRAHFVDHRVDALLR